MSNPINSKYRTSAKKQTNEKDQINKRKNFSAREVGLTHPDNSSFIRLNDSGDIELFAAPGIGIVISAATRTISLFADNIRFHTKEDGLKWNSMDFNYSANDFTEPTFIKSNPEEYNPAYINISTLLNKLDELISAEEEQQDIQNDVTIQGNYLYAESNKDITSDYAFKNEESIFSLFTENQVSLLKADWEKSLKDKLSLIKFTEYIVNLMQSGYTFNQAKEKAIKDNNV